MSLHVALFSMICVFFHKSRRLNKNQFHFIIKKKDFKAPEKLPAHIFHAERCPKQLLAFLPGVWYSEYTLCLIFQETHTNRGTIWLTKFHQNASTAAPAKVNVLQEQSARQTESGRSTRKAASAAEHALLYAPSEQFQKNSLNARFLRTAIKTACGNAFRFCFTLTRQNEISTGDFFSLAFFCGLCSAGVS